MFLLALRKHTKQSIFWYFYDGRNGEEKYYQIISVSDRLLGILNLTDSTWIIYKSCAVSDDGRESLKIRIQLWLSPRANCS